MGERNRGREGGERTGRKIGREERRDRERREEERLGGVRWRESDYLAFINLTNLGLLHFVPNPMQIESHLLQSIFSDQYCHPVLPVSPGQVHQGKYSGLQRKDSVVV